MATSDSRKMSSARVSMEMPPARLSRRRSTFRGVARSVTEVLSLHRLSKANVASDLPQPILENTYKMEPDDDQRFSVSTVEGAVNKVLEDTLCDTQYNASTCAAMTQFVTDRVRHAVKSMDIPRYKIVCNVIIGQNKQQDLELASRAVWNSRTDNYACVTYKNSSLFAVALVYGVYFE